MVLNLRLQCVEMSMKIQLVQVRIIVRNDTCRRSPLQELGAYHRVQVHVRLQEKKLGRSLVRLPFMTQ